jgi:flagellar motility protein MotE (MotC chaperone)
MKSILPYILLITGTLVGAVAIIAGIYYFRPQLLGGGQKPSQVVAREDSAGAKSPGSSPEAQKDSSGAKSPGSSLATAQKSDSTAKGTSASASPKAGEASHLADSIRTLISRIEEQQKTIAQLTEKVPQAGGPDSTVKLSPADSVRAAKDSKTFAKMLESMPAEQAVRILKGLDDKEVKTVLLVVKKRQAAKILSVLDPERAARMMRTLQ